MKERAYNTVSTKQLTKTVVEGRKVTFSFQGIDPISGYICGMDDYHWLVITSHKDLFLIHKANALFVQLFPESTLKDEDDADFLDTLIAPYRAYIEIEIFNKKTQDDREGGNVKELRR